MTLPSSTRRVGPFPGTGAPALFPFTFKVFTKTDVSAQLTVSGVTTTLAQDSDYTITLNADQDATPGGEVAYTLAVGATLTLLGALPYTQPTDLPSGGAYRAKVVEDALDRLAIQTQQLAEKSDRSLLFSPGFQGDAELPGDAALAGRLLTFDPVTGAPGPSVFTSAQVAAAVGAASPGGASATIVGRETIVATAGQTDFTLSSLSYAPGVGALYVIAGGLFVRKEQVTELSGTTFRLAVAQPAGVEVEAIVARFITSGVEMRQIGALTGVAEHLSGGATDQASYFFKRRATYSGGTPGFVNSGLRVETYVESSTGSGTSSATAFEWSLLGIVYNYAAAGENVGGYFQGNKYNTGGTWGAVAEAIDHRSAVVDPLDDMIGLEVDVRANGTDNNYSRIGIDVVMSRPYTGGVPSGAAMQGGYGVRIQSGGDTLADVNIGFSVNLDCLVGFDAAGSTPSIAAFRMAENQKIAFNVGASRTLAHDGIGFKFADGANNLLMRFNDTGLLQLGIAGTAATTPGSFAANRVIRLQQLDGTVLYLPAMLATW